MQPIGLGNIGLFDLARIEGPIDLINSAVEFIGNGMSGTGLSWKYWQKRRASIGGLFIIAGTVIIVWIVINAKTRYLLELEPPAQYNHPYAGRVDERVMSVSEVRKLCTSLGASARGVACSWISDGACHIILPNDELAPVHTYRRHEIAHCN